MKRLLILLPFLLFFTPINSQTNEQVDAITEEILSKLNVDTITKNIKHLENYVSRCYLNPSGLLASQQWIYDTYKRYSQDYEVSLQPISLSLPLGYIPNPSEEICENASNVIVIKKGTIDPDKYMIVGGHFDSFNNDIFFNPSFDGAAPGADDNASGTAAVMEMARVMADYESDYSIIFCAWNLEEIGLFGSKEFVKQAKAEGMDIIGYINLDMIGYICAENEFITSVDTDNRSKPLYEKFKEIASIYTPELIVKKMVSFGGGGGSDHASFQAEGYKAIFPFEKSGSGPSPALNPYYHSVDDVFGKGLNSMEFAMMLTKSSLATVIYYATEGHTSISELHIPIDNVSVYPNPITSEGVLSFTISTPDNVQIGIYDITGKCVQTLANDYYYTGSHDINICSDNLKVGIYIVKIDTSNYNKTVRFIVR